MNTLIKIFVVVESMMTVIKQLISIAISAPFFSLNIQILSDISGKSLDYWHMTYLRSICGV